MSRGATSRSIQINGQCRLATARTRSKGKIVIQCARIGMLTTEQFTQVQNISIGPRGEVFDGIREGVSGCNMRPLVTEVNARERYEDYFNVFFADGGEYKKYVTLRDTKKRSANKSKDKVGYSYEMTIRVLRSQLKARLKADNVIDKDHL